VSSQTDKLLGPGPQRPSRSERQWIRERYGLPPNPRGKVQRLLPDIIAFRDQKATVPEIARVFGISEVSVKAVIKKYPAPLGRSAERKLTNRIVAAYAKGQPAGAIAKRFGITVPGVMHRLREARKPLEKTTRNVPAPEWLAAANRRRCVELGQDVMVMKEVPPEVIAALKAWRGGHRKVRGKPFEPVKIIQVAALTAQGLPRDEIAKQLGIGLSTVYRVLDKLRKHMPNKGTPSIDRVDEDECTEAKA
jgi:DNA invertase Pin-like site-specific DNA recombinase